MTLQQTVLMELSYIGFFTSFAKSDQFRGAVAMLRQLCFNQVSLFLSVLTVMQHKCIGVQNSFVGKNLLAISVWLGT